ncbi:MAG TPA: flagellar basal body-associated FliL family protein [Bauldia sp.]|nr:flagellar basal body-associated FliL family protein [Bauldia sp.]
MAAKAKIEEPEEEEELEEDEESGEEGEEQKPEAPPAKKGGWLGLLAVIGIVTAAAGGLGAALGMQTTAAMERVIADRTKAPPAPELPRSAVFDADMSVLELDAVVTNLAEPSDVWIRLETAIVFAKDAIKNPSVTADEIRQDIVAYARTLTLAQLEGPSALNHLREDLNERAAVRTGGAVNQLIIQSLVVQ